MSPYELHAKVELMNWKLRMLRPPSLTNKISTATQKRINRMIPEKIHQTFTAAIKQMTKAVLFGASYTTGKPQPFSSLEEAEITVKQRIIFYRTTAAAEGGITGAGGILLGLADFPLWLTLKMKMLFEIAQYYGFDTTQFSERIYLLNIFQLTFSSQEHRNELFHIMADWDKASKKYSDINDFDWRAFQIEYRDYIDLAKLLQLIPGFGAIVGVYVNHRLTDKLGTTAMNAYRMRLL